jgi:hypothetical protein
MRRVQPTECQCCCTSFIPQQLHRQQEMGHLMAWPKLLPDSPIWIATLQDKHLAIRTRDRRNPSNGRAPGTDCEARRNKVGHQHSDFYQRLGSVAFSGETSINILIVQHITIIQTRYHQHFDKISKESSFGRLYSVWGTLLTEWRGRIFNGWAAFADTNGMATGDNLILT